jgi:hypothetical protein
VIGYVTSAPLGRVTAPLPAPLVEAALQAWKVLDAIYIDGACSMSGIEYGDLIMRSTRVPAKVG